MKRIPILLLVLFVISCKENKSEKIVAEDTTTEITSEVATNDSLIFPEEIHFKSMRQVTFGGDNAEAYWSFDDKQLVFQSNWSEWGLECDQMFLMNADDTFKDTKPPMISTGKGRTTCAYFLPEKKRCL